MPNNVNLFAIINENCNSLPALFLFGVLFRNTREKRNSTIVD